MPPVSAALKIATVQMKPNAGLGAGEVYPDIDSASATRLASSWRSTQSSHLRNLPPPFRFIEVTPRRIPVSSGPFSAGERQIGCSPDISDS